MVLQVFTAEEAPRLTCVRRLWEEGGGASCSSMFKLFKQVGRIIGLPQYLFKMYGPDGRECWLEGMGRSTRALTPATHKQDPQDWVIRRCI